MADMPVIMEISRRHGLIVIEDAAQAIGSELRGIRAGSIGDLACFSFFPSKNLGAFGDGGMITTNNADLAERIRLLRSHGFKTKYHNEILGGNFRLDEIQAAVLRVKLKYLDQWTEGRRRNATLYRQNLQGTALELPYEVPDARHIYNQFVIRAKRRDELVAHLRAQSIGSEIYYPIPLHLLPCFKNLGHHVGDFPVSEATANESLALPIYPELTADMIHAVCESLTF
jgi:dTDP-4-amino-4,6-dideoxygalactose transaminase